MNTLRPIRVLLVDDQEIVRQGLSLMLQALDDMLLVGQVGNALSIVQLCAELTPDVVLMDLMMPEIDGIEATRLLMESYPNVRIIVLTSFIDSHMVQRVLKAGAIGYLLKNTSIDDLTNAVRGAMAGKSVLSVEATQALIEAARQPLQPGHDLTQREREVLALMVNGLTNIKIAEQLSVSHSTVKTHVSNIIAKLGATGRVEAVALALQHHLISS